MMKKTWTALSALALSLSVSQPSFAEDSAAKGIEFSGNTSVVVGFQQDDSAALNAAGGQLTLLRGKRSPSRTTFNFYLDQFELDIDKSLGDKIRIRADLDFGRALSGSGRATENSNFVVEQAYLTVGVLGGELALGRFNAPVGYYVVDPAYNPTISFSNIYNFLTPTNVTGAKMYWSLGENFDLNVYAVNQLFDCLQIGGSCLTGPGDQGDSAIPSFGARIGYKWGQDKTASTIGLSYLAGPEQKGSNSKWDHMIDLDFAMKPTEQMLIAGEGIFYLRSNLPSIDGPNGKFFGALVLLDYSFSESWNAFFSYGYVNDMQGVVTGVDQQVHNALIGVGYQITEGAKLKLEYRADLFLYEKQQANRPELINPGVAIADTSSISHGVAAELDYSF